MRPLPLVLAVILLAVPGSTYAQDPHAGHAPQASGGAQAPAPAQEDPTVVPQSPQTLAAPARGSDLASLMSRINEATGDAKVALMAELLGRLVVAHGTQGSSGMCSGAGHSCPMCQAHGSMMKPGTGSTQSR